MFWINTKTGENVSLAALVSSGFNLLNFVPQSPRQPGLAQESEDDLCFAFWLGAPGGHSHHHHCAAVFCLEARAHTSRQTHKQYKYVTMLLLVCVSVVDNSFAFSAIFRVTWLLQVSTPRLLRHLFQAISGCRYITYFRPHSPVFSQHMMKLKTIPPSSLYFSPRPGWKMKLAGGIDLLSKFVSCQSMA